MPALFGSAIRRSALRHERRLILTHMIRTRFRQWQHAVQRRKREQALAECLRRLDRRTLEDIGLDLTSEPAQPSLATETEIHAVRNRARGIT